MEEEIIEIFEKILNNKRLIVSIIRKGDIFIVEKCIVDKNVIFLNYQKSFKHIDRAMQKANLLEMMQ